MHSGSFKAPRPANWWAPIESELLNGLPTRSSGTSTFHNAGGGRRVMLDEDEVVEQKALPRTLKPPPPAFRALPPNDEARHSHSKSPHVPRLLSLSRPACL